MQHIHISIPKVEVANMKAYIGKIRYKEDTDILAIMVGLLAAALFTAVVVGILIVLIMKKKKKKIIKEFKMELLTREEMIRKASREGMRKQTPYICTIKYYILKQLHLILLKCAPTKQGDLMKVYLTLFDVFF